MKQTLYWILPVLLCIAGGAGCIKKSESTDTYKPFESVELDALLNIQIDLSGSFRGQWTTDGKAYRLFMELINRFFTEGTGSDARIILAQISDSDNVTLFEGTPQELARRFRSPESLSQFLVDHSDPKGSQVHRSVKRSLDYVTQMPEVSTKTKVLTVILSDMIDSEKDTTVRQQTAIEMQESLRAYASRGAGVALYFVNEDLKPNWRHRLEQAGFVEGSYVVEGELIESPRLPSFD